MFKSGSIRSGPQQSIICSPPHDRPVFSMAVGEDTFVTGSADHGLREYKLIVSDSGKFVRELFNKKYGHKEWVSTCSYTPSGKILSGAMDSVVCFWDAKAVRCDHFMGHKAPISKVAGDDRIGISASYDATLILWDLKKKDVAKTLLGPHKQAIMQFEWKNSLIASGDKSGVLAFWDLNECKLIKAIKAHKGAISNIRIHEKQQLLITTGLNDGSITGIDMRTNSPVFRKMIHKGSVNDIKLMEGKNYFATCSADGMIKILNLPDFETVLEIKSNEMLFSLEGTEETILAGSQKGNVLAYDVLSGKSLYGYGVMKKGACRILKFNRKKNRLVCAGQDDSATLLKF